MMKLLAFLLSLGLVAAACSSDDGGETGADGETVETSGDGDAEPDEDADTAAGDPAATGDDDGSTDAGGGTDDGAVAGLPASDDTTGNPDGADGAAGPGPLGPFLMFVFDASGTEPTEEVVACFEGRDLDPGLSLDASEDELARAILAVSACAPEAAAVLAVEDLALPEGVEQGDAVCVLTIAYQELATYPEDEAFVLLESESVPPELRGPTVERAAGECGLSEVQITGILDGT